MSANVNGQDPAPEDRAVTEVRSPAGDGRRRSTRPGAMARGAGGARRRPGRLRHRRGDLQGDPRRSGAGADSGLGGDGRLAGEPGRGRCPERGPGLCRAGRMPGRMPGHRGRPGAPVGDRGDCSRAPRAGPGRRTARRHLARDDQGVHERAGHHARPGHPALDGDARADLWPDRSGRGPGLRGRSGRPTAGAGRGWRGSSGPSWERSPSTWSGPLSSESGTPASQYRRPGCLASWHGWWWPSRPPGASS